MTAEKKQLAHKMTFFDAILNAVREQLGIPDLALEKPRDKSHGDFSTNAAMQMAGRERGGGASAQDLPDSKAVKQAYPAHATGEGAAPSQFSSPPRQTSLHSAAAPRPSKENRRATNPREIAAELLPRILELPFVESAESAGPGFINFRVKDSFIIKFINEREASATPAKAGGDGPDGPFKPETIDLDYGSYNVAKTLHIGHLRGSIIGDTFYRIARFLGHRPISYNHMGDWGRPIALVIAWITRLFPNEWNRPDFAIDAAALNSYYPAASAFAKENPEFLDQVRRIKKDFQDGRADYSALYDKILSVSLDQMNDVVRRLNMLPFDNNLGERNAAKYLAPVEEILRSKNLLRESDGAVVVDVKRDGDDAPMPPLMWRDSNGADTYDSTDLATVYYRKIIDNPDRIIYFTDYRQTLHFEQLFRASDLSGIFPHANMEFPGFGGINGTDGKPLKTRDGSVASLSDMIDMVDQAAARRVADGGNSLPESTVKMIALAALKFNDLMHDIKSDYIFDPAAVVQFEGRTGPYILYTAVRLNSVLRRGATDDGRATRRPSSPSRHSSAAADIHPDENRKTEERDLLLKILEFPRAIQGAFDRRAPDILANYTYGLCQSANVFYHSHQIKDNPERLAITRKTAETLAICIDLMGLQVPDEM